MSVIDCPVCPEGGYDVEGPRNCCGVYTLGCTEHEPEVEWVEQTGQVLPPGYCVCP